MERWTRTPEGTWNVLRTFEETHAISAMANSTTGYEKRRLETNHWRQITQGTACSRADICRSETSQCEVSRFCLFEFNYRMWDIQPKKINTPKKNRHFLYGGSFPLINSISINQHKQFLNGLSMRKLTQ